MLVVDASDRVPSFTGFYCVFQCVLPSFTGFYRVLPSFTEFYQVSGVAIELKPD